MKRENVSEITTIDTTSNHRVYYAPAASTSGDKVKIYRRVFESMNAEYRISLLNTTNPIKRALIKYEWAEFILEQLPNYSDCRSNLYNGAKVMIINAFNTIEGERYSAKKSLNEAVKALNDFTCHIASLSVASGDIRRAIEVRKTELKDEISRRRKHYGNITALCPDQKFEQIKRRAEYFDSIW